MGKQHFQLCCKSKPLWAGAGVPDPGREIHDDHLKNLGKHNYFPQRPREYSGRGDETPLDSWIQDTVYQENLIKPMGNSISSYAAKAVRQSTIEANHT